LVLTVLFGVFLLTIAAKGQELQNPESGYIACSFPSDSYLGTQAHYNDYLGKRQFKQYEARIKGKTKDVYLLSLNNDYPPATNYLADEISIVILGDNVYMTLIKNGCAYAAFTFSKTQFLKFHEQAVSQKEKRA